MTHCTDLSICIMSSGTMNHNLLLLLFSSVSTKDLFCSKTGNISLDKHCGVIAEGICTIQLYIHGNLGDGYWVKVSDDAKELCLICEESSDKKFEPDLSRPDRTVLVCLNSRESAKANVDESDNVTSSDIRFEGSVKDTWEVVCLALLCMVCLTFLCLLASVAFKIFSCRTTFSYPQSEPARSLTISSSMSGSGSDGLLLLQRSIAHDIKLRDRIGRGRFGDVWRADWKDQAVAVKVFSDLEYESWLHETSLLLTPLISNKNIVSYIASDHGKNSINVSTICTFFTLQIHQFCLTLTQL